LVNSKCPSSSLRAETGTLPRGTSVSLTSTPASSSVWPRAVIALTWPMMDAAPEPAPLEFGSCPEPGTEHTRTVASSASTSRVVVEWQRSGHCELWFRWRVLMSPKFVPPCPAARDLVRVIRDIVVPFLPRTTARTMPNLLSCGKRLRGMDLQNGYRIW
jgi:hypothetical protein